MVKEKVSALLAEVPDVMDHEVQRLILTAAATDPSWLVGDPEVDADVATRFREMVERRRCGEPLQYIEGTVQFGPIELLTDSRALIPRPETERLYEIAAAAVAGIIQPTIVDLCTGSGNLALALKHAHPDASVTGCDQSASALSLAKENARRLGLDVRFVHGDLFDALPAELAGRVDLIASNPPYVAPGEFEALPTEVRDHEPRQALVAEHEGLEILSRIASQASRWLAPEGIIICEIGETQGAACVDLFSALHPQIESDLVGRDRFVVGRAPMCPNLH